MSELRPDRVPEGAAGHGKTVEKLARTGPPEGSARETATGRLSGVRVVRSRKKEREAPESRWRQGTGDATSRSGGRSSAEWSAGPRTAYQLGRVGLATALLLLARTTTRTTPLRRAATSATAASTTSTTASATSTSAASTAATDASTPATTPTTSPAPSTASTTTTSTAPASPTGTPAPLAPAGAASPARGRRSAD
ncbi:unnamed protein product [Closterium sp. NIES-53]